MWRSVSVVLVAAETFNISSEMSVLSSLSVLLILINVNINKFKICFRIPIQGNRKWRSLSIKMFFFVFFQIKFYLDYFNIMQKISAKFNYLLKTSIQLSCLKAQWDKKNLVKNELGCKKWQILGLITLWFLFIKMR